MKKLLLIGAIFIVGVTSFSEILIKLNEDVPNPGQGQKYKYTGEGKMEVISRGSILDPTGRVLLVIEPAISTGADHTTLAFDFGKLTRRETRIRESEFIAKILKNKEQIPILNKKGQSAISAEILNGEVQELQNINREKIGTIGYALSPASGLETGNILYRGRVKAEIALGRNLTDANIADAPVGSFTHDKSSVKVTVTSINVQ